MRINKISVKFLILVCLSFFISSCSSKVSLTPTTAIQPDAAYYQFGEKFAVQIPDDFSKYDPHQVAQYSVYLIKEGRTEELLKQIGHVEKDQALGNSFITFLREFGPDLERYKGKNISLKFEGVKEEQDTSVWYYYLVDEQGNTLDDKSWVSLHRSRVDGRCALTGIFLNLPEFGEPDYMPEGLMKSN
jgi:hypothetical protein